MSTIHTKYNRVKDMDNTITRTLEGAGFLPKEAQIYSALLEIRQGDVSEIAQKANQKRSNVYSILEKLEDKGYVSAVPGVRVKQYIPADPLRVLHSLQEATSTLKDMLPIIRALYNKSNDKPRVQYFEGKKGAIGVYREINQFPEAFFISSVERYQKHMPEDYKYWLNGLERQTIKYKARFLLPKTKSDLNFAKNLSQKKLGHEVRWLPKGQTISMEFALYGNKLAITSIADPFFVVVIESENIYKSVKTIFEIIWEKAEK